jgi:glycosyltransferase involved in cell wall biosynthesis
MRILQVNKFNYIRGGAEKYFIEISKKLEKEGHQLATFSMHHPKNNPSPWDKYFVSRISFNEGGLRDKIIAPFRIVYSLEAKRKFKKIVKDFKPDIIHIHNIYHQISPSILDIAKKYKVPVVMHLHDYKLICPNYQLFVDNKICYRCKGGKYYNCIKHKCFKKSLSRSILATVEMWFHHKILNIYKDNVSQFIAPSDFMRKTVVDFGIDAKKVSLVYNFSEELEVSKNIDEVENYGLYFGRISDEKGIDVLLKAFSIYNGNMKLKIVGSGPSEEKIKTMSKELGLENKVEFLGSKFGEDLVSIIQKAKTIFIPSIWNENMPLTLLESLYLSKVVIASRTGGLPELIDDKETGFLFNNGDATQLANLIEGLDKYNLMEMGKEAKSKIENLSIDKHFIEIMRIYNKLKNTDK